MKLKRIFRPITINNLTLKNRIAMPAIHHLYTPDGYATPRFNEYYWKRVEGGAGLIMVGGCRVDEYGGAGAMMSLHKDEYITSFKEFTDGVHQREGKVAVQLYHAGRYTSQSNVPEGKQALAPSAVYSRFTRETAKEMTREEIQEVIKNWTQAGVRAREAGFDAVEVIGSAGYLISQFLSTTTNLREDEYGGSWENRCRFPLEVVASFRKALGNDYPIFMRIAGNDFIPESNTNEQAVEFAKLMEKAGIDMLNVTGGWHESRVPQITGDLPRGGYTYLAGAIKKAVSIPVMACNRINDPVVAEEILALGRADLIGVARPMIADPEWCNKAREGRFDEIRRCVACNQGCLAKTFFAKPIECLVNGEAGREYLMEEIKPAEPKRVLVVGSGPAGSEFAIRAAQRGHHVTLWEKGDTVGGQIPIVATPPGKGEFTALASYYEAMLKKTGVTVELCKDASLENVKFSGFDTVVVATGSREKTIPLPLQDSSVTVCTAAQVLSREIIPGKDVIVVGGGSVGCEVAQYMAHKGSISEELLFFLMSQQAETVDFITNLLNSTDRKVSIVEIQKAIGTGFELGTSWPLLKDLKRLGVVQHTLASITDISRGKATVKKTNKEGAEEILEIPCDTVVLSVGYESVNELYNSLESKVPELHIIGDAGKVGKISDAVRTANDLANQI